MNTEKRTRKLTFKCNVCDAVYPAQHRGTCYAEWRINIPEETIKVQERFLKREQGLHSFYVRVLQHRLAYLQLRIIREGLPSNGNIVQMTNEARALQHALDILSAY